MPTDADKPDVSSTMVEQIDYDERRKLLANIIRATAGTGLVGLGLGGGYQLAKALNRSDLAGHDDPAAIDHVLPLPARKRRPRSLSRSLEFPKVASSWADRLASGLLGVWPGSDRSVSAGSGSGSPPWYERLRYTLARHPWAGPLAITAPMVSGAAGWGLASHLGDSARKAEQETDLEEAQREYEEALSGRPIKSATHDKRAIFEWLSALPGAYYAYAAPTALGAAAYAYHRHRKDREDVLKAALRRRALMRALESPPPVHYLGRPDEREDLEASEQGAVTARKRG